MAEVDDFEVETNSEPAPVAEAVAPVQDETTEAPVAARDRDGAGRYAAKPQPAEDVTDDVDDEPPADPDPKKPAKPRDDPQARVQQAVTRQREAERRAEAAERRAQELEARQRPSPREAQEPAREPAAPRFPRFEVWLAQNQAATHDDYLDARDDWRDHARDQQTHQRIQQSEAQRQRHAIATTFKQDIDSAIAADAQFLTGISQDVLSVPTFETLRDGERPGPLHFLGEELLRAEKPTALMRYWTEHPDKFQRFATLPPREITRQIAIDEDRASAAARTAGTAPKAMSTSQAKPPMRPVIGSPHASGDEPPDPDDDDLDRHAAFYNAQEKRARARR